MSLKMEDLTIDLSMDRVMNEYPMSCLPNKLKRRTNKAKHCAFEEIDENLYEPAAKMIAYHTELNRTHAWIKAFEVLYYNNLGNSDDVAVKWVDDPPSWKDSNSTANAIIIDYSSKNPDLPNPLFFKITFYVTTGTIQVQGNEKDIFVHDHFEILKKLVEMVIKDNQGSSFQREKVLDDQDCMILSPDSEQTVPKTVYETESDHEEELGCISEGVTLHDLKQDSASSSCTKDKHDDKTGKSIVVSTKSDTIMGDDASDRFDKCVSRMEQSFIKAVQELSKTQAEIFTRTMKAVNVEISNTVVSQFKPMGETISKSLTSNLQPIKDDISKSLSKQIEPIGEEISKSVIRKLQPVLDGKDKIESLNSEHSAKISALQESFQTRLANQTEKHKKQLEEVEINYKREIQSLKNEHDSESREFKRKLEKCDKEILSLKMHASRTSDLDDGSVEVVGSSAQRNPSRSSAGRNIAASGSSHTINNSSQSASSENIPIDTRPRVFLIGTSNIRKIKEDKLSSAVNMTKHVSYTLSETLSLINQMNREPSPAEIVLHVLTNDIKNFTPEECVDKLNEIITETKSKWPFVKIVISLETPRADCVELNTKVILLNTLIIQKFINTSNIILCNNSNLTNNGEPIRSLLENDLYHLSSQGVSRLAANIKRVIHESLRLDTVAFDRVGQPGDGGSSKNFPPFFRSFPFFPAGYYFNNRRGRGRGKRGHHFQ